MRTILAIFFLVFSSVIVLKAKDEVLSWPLEITEQNYLITLYQPQLETLVENTLDGRMALSIKDDKNEMYFGALWFTVRLETDLSNRTAVMKSMEIPMIKFPDVDDESKLEKLKEVIITNLVAMDYEMSLDQILASLETVETKGKLEDELNNASPDIYFRKEATVLVSIDGDPIVKKVENSELEYVVNTPFFIVKHKGIFYLNGGDFWYRSDNVISNDWKETKTVPKEAKKLAEQQKNNSDIPNEDKKAQKEEGAPKIISTSKPSELVVTDGEASYEPIPQTSLLYVTNSESDIIMDITSQQHFLLINGRWYNSKTLQDGDWNFMEPGNLPEDFSKIPADTTLSISSVRVSVPGTPEAESAMFEQYIPQTAVVDRKTATVDVKYDGEPKFEKIDGTETSYAVNTEKTVLKINNSYYCVDEGIWFESTSATGPWKVTDSRPDEVDEIPPSSPVYNVKYVYIYDSTPDVVYVGYTPGYYNSFVYGGVVVYGTGFYYRPWYGYYYYPRPVTYGFGVHYNPYTGWGFSVGFSFGWVSYRHPYYWGPCGYRYGYRHGYYHGYHHGYHRGYAAGYASGYARGRYNSNNIYQRRPSGIQQTRNNTRPVTANNRVRPSTRPNNVYTDKSGNIHQRDNNGNWQQVNKRPATGNQPAQRPSTQPAQRPSTQQAQRPSTQPAQRPSTQPAQRPSTQPAQRPSTRPAQPSNLERQYQNRSTGNTNYQRYQNNRPTNTMRGAPARPSGGGARRR